jgi:[glutamine synthetase] adenylyltransferase / [glutamine synthetase]-adenylyl-L-tyrosine phosphorylase
MVTLPQLDSYSEKDLTRFHNYSPLFSHYLKICEKKGDSCSDIIRLNKHKHWLKCAFATLSNKIDTETICRYWTEQTDIILRQAWLDCNLSEEVTLLAMGKLGSNELNLSSDIDVIFVQENDTLTQENSSKIKNFIQLVSAKTAFGFAYRVDINLRPGGELSPLIPSRSHFFNYYDEYTEAWNRMSFIRMRYVLGSLDLADKINEYCMRMSYPRRLDFSVIEEIKNIRTKIQYQWRKASEPLDIKFQPGGIRDIELYIQSLQVIYGGRHPQLKTSSISEAMKTLKDLSIIDKNEYDFINDFYWHLRTIENHIHIYADKQTYVLSKDILEKIPHITNEITLTQQLDKMLVILNNFFIPPDSQTVEFDIANLNLSKKSQDFVNEILNLKSRSSKKNELDKKKKLILDRFLLGVDKIAIDKDLAIEIFRDFIFSINSKSSIFYLLDRHEELLENLTWLFSISPYVGQVLCRRPELLDSFAIGSVDININEETDILMENLIDYKFLGQLISIIYFLKNKDIITFTEQLSHHANVIVTNLIKHLEIKISTEGVNILCLGKWSGFELGVQSDLDFVFITDNAPTENQRRLVKRLLNLLTQSTKVGKLYDIDMRLKPNESSGPLLIEKSLLLDYLGSRSESWQKQAYLRSRLLNSKDFFLKNQIEKLWINEVDLIELYDIQSKILTNPDEKLIDLKSCKGGLIHTEFEVQKHCLLQHINLAETTTSFLIDNLKLSAEAKLKIKNNYFFIRNFEQIFQICSGSSSTKVSKENQNLPRIAKLLELTDPFSELYRVIQEQQRLLNDLT